MSAELIAGISTATEARPDYVHCVIRAANGHPNGGMTWCGRDVHREWLFQDVTHAVLNSANGGYLMTCPECATAIGAALARGTYDPDAEGVK